MAYRTHGGQPFHYIVRSYDERGRVEAQLRLTENLGFDAVYYRYNALNKLTSVHVVDATGQHATFYGYDSEGRVSRMWAERRNGGGFGLGTSMTPQRPTLIDLDRQSLPHAVYDYDAADAVTSVEYPRLGVTTTIDVNARGAQLRTRTQKFNQLAPVIFEQRLAYDDLDQITAAWSTANGMADVEDYHYDVLGRLISVQGTDAALMNPRSESYGYDLAGNRRNALNNINGIAQTYTHAPTTNRLTRFIQSEAGNPLYRDHTLAYQSDGALATRTRSDAQGAQMVQRNESFAYDAFGLIERYRVQRDVGGMQGVCAPDASSQPISEWRYRFGPLQEREQKRQYLSDVPADGLAWTYTLLGADAKQLASYNGIQGAFCGQPPTTVWLWPVEYNSYGPAHTRVIMRPGGTPEYVLHDHLGSARITLDNAARVIESQSYTAYGDHRTHDGEAARTSYIGRETDKESDLGFNGVRLYDPTYGRFLSVDPLWGKYLPLQSYQYCRNNPIMRTDRSGMADFFDEDGTLVGNNGIDDGLKFIGNKSVYQSYQKDGYSFDDMTQLGGVYQLPSASALTAMESSIIDKASSPFSTDSRREYGGVIGDDGNFYAAPKGPVATGESQGPMVNLAPAIAAAEASGSRPLSLVHSHVNFDIIPGAVLQGNKSPSDVDRDMLKDQKLAHGAYGLVIYPVVLSSKGNSTLTFFRIDAKNKSGQATDVTTTYDKVKTIVKGSEK